MFRCVASYCQTMVASVVGGTMALLLILLFGGFLIPHRKTFPCFHEFVLQARYWPTTIEHKLLTHFCVKLLQHPCLIG